MEITRYKRADCQQLLEDETFWANGSLPTSRMRVTSYINNPNVRDDDVLLYTAHKDGELASYIAVLPDFIRATKDAGLTPFGWPSSWWARTNPPLGPGASILLFKILSDWKSEIALSGFSDEARAVFDASRRFKLLKMFDLTAYAVKLPSEFKGRRIPGAPINALLDLKNRYYSSRAKRSPVLLSVIDGIDEEMDRFLTEQTKDDLFPRTGVFFDWIIKYPWIRNMTDEDRKPESEMNRYYFQDAREIFQQLPVKLVRDGEITGFLLFTLNDDFLTVKYAIFQDEELDTVKEFIQLKAIETGVPFLWCADDRLNRKLAADRFFYLATKRFDIPFYIGKPVKYDTSARIHYGLGDKVMS